MKIIDTGNICKSFGIVRIPQYCLDFFLQPIESNLQIVNSKTQATSAVIFVIHEMLALMLKDISYNLFDSLEA